MYFNLDLTNPFSEDKMKIKSSDIRKCDELSILKEWYQLLDTHVIHMDIRIKKMETVKIPKAEEDKIPELKVKLEGLIIYRLSLIRAMGFIQLKIDRLEKAEKSQIQILNFEKKFWEDKCLLLAPENYENYEEELLALKEIEFINSLK